MKRFMLFLQVCLVVLLICGCARGATPGDGALSGGASGSGSASTAQDSTFTYRPPAQAVQIDLSADDPSDENIRFVYDDSGRVSQCYYTVDGQEIYVNYRYDGDVLQIYAFAGQTVVADTQIRLSGAYDASIGFANLDGYYVKGYARSAASETGAETETQSGSVAGTWQKTFKCSDVDREVLGNTIGMNEEDLDYFNLSKLEMKLLWRFDENGDWIYWFDFVDRVEARELFRAAATNQVESWAKEEGMTVPELLDDYDTTMASFEESYLSSFDYIVENADVFTEEDLERMDDIGYGEPGKWKPDGTMEIMSGSDSNSYGMKAEYTLSGDRLTIKNFTGVGYGEDATGYFTKFAEILSGTYERVK